LYELETWCEYSLYAIYHVIMSRVRGDMIEVYKFFNNMYSATTGWLTDRHYVNKL